MPVLFAAIVIAVNWQGLRTPAIEGTDLAANSLQVFHAKQGRELLGNYSRWEFHHPGPAMFYVLGAGEYLFCDWLRVVPSAVNAQWIMLVLWNTALLFGVIEIWVGHAGGEQFRALAWTGAVVVICLVNQTIGQSALVSLWMPHVALFPFLFFVTACISVAAGRMRHLPLLTLGGMLMVHLHMAQVLFAGALGAAAVLSAGVRLRGGMRGQWRAIGLSVGIVALFLAPIGLELAIHHPNNLDAVRGYLAKYPNPNNGIARSFAYFVSFLTFTEKSEELAPGAGLALGWVQAYWVLLVGGMLVTARGRWTRFQGTAVGALVLVTPLFLYWANRITGPLYNFNGYFLYSVHFVLVLLLMGRLAGRVRGWGRAVWLLPVLATVLAAGRLAMPGLGMQGVGAISRGLEGAGAVKLLFRHDDWDTAVGVANQLARRGQGFCVDAGWAYLFGYGSGCGAGQWKRVVIDRGGWYEQGRVPLVLPAQLECTEEVTARREGFYGPEGEHCWSGKEASLEFLLSGPEAPAYTLALRGSVLPERPVEVLLNGHQVGVVENLWNSQVTLRVAGEVLKISAVNRIEFRVPAAGAIAGDGRELGFSLISVGISGAGTGIEAAR